MVPSKIMKKVLTPKDLQNQCSCGDTGNKKLKEKIRRSQSWWASVRLHEVNISNNELDTSD